MAVIGTNEENREGRRVAGSETGVSGEMTGVDSACNSFWEEDGTGVGATGADGPLEAAQHGILQQCPPWQQHDLAAHEAPEAASGEIATAGYAARMNPSSNAAAIFVSFQTMFCEPPKLSHIGAGIQASTANMRQNTSRQLMGVGLTEATNVPKVFRRSKKTIAPNGKETEINHAPYGGANEPLKSTKAIFSFQFLIEYKAQEHQGRRI